MKHLSPKELLMLAEGSELSTSDMAHIAGCSSCSAELKRMKALLVAVAAHDERPLDEQLLGQMAEGIMQRIAELPQAERLTQSKRRWRHSVKWASAAALPLAAAVLLFVLSQQEGLSRLHSGSVKSPNDDLLSPQQWDVVWDSLTEDMPELSVLQQVSTIDEDPYGQLRTLTEEQLQSLLDLLGSPDLG